MPLYEFKCPHCQHTQEESRKIDERDKPLECSRCGQQTKRHIALVSGNFPGASTWNR